MRITTLRQKLENDFFAEEKLSIRAFGSSEGLKDRIRKKISDYGEKGWNLACILIEGPFILLRFKQND